MRIIENIDKTIEAICDWIQGQLNQTGSVEDSLLLPEMTKALAEVISARAKAYPEIIR